MDFLRIRIFKFGCVKFLKQVAFNCLIIIVSKLINVIRHGNRTHICRFMHEPGLILKGKIQII